MALTATATPRVRADVVKVGACNISCCNNLSLIYKHLFSNWG